MGRRRGARHPGAEARTRLRAVLPPPRDAAGRTGGSGIGLAVVREIARLHGGTAWAESAPGGGTPHPDAVPRCVSPGRRGRPARRFLTAGSMQPYPHRGRQPGSRLRPAQQPRDRRLRHPRRRGWPRRPRQASVLQPDLIILDLMMPGMDGYRVLRTLREEGNSTPVLILSAQRDEEADKVRGFRMGADDFVTKPFSLLELLARVEALLRRAATETRHASAETYSSATSRSTPTAQRIRRSGRPVVVAPQGVCPPHRAAPPRRRRRDAATAAPRSVGPPERREHPHRRYAHRRTPPQARGRAGAPRHIVTVRKTGYRIQP
jgi:CheY-like chemotaxis protein